METLRILVVSQKGGVGKSTLSANLAAWCSEIAKKTTALIDLDPHGSSSSWISSARKCPVHQEHFIADSFSERRWLIDSRNKIRKYTSDYECIICDLTWTAAMDSEFMHEFDLVIVPSSVSSIELNATMKFLENIKWVFQAKAGIPPTLLICPSRVLDEQLGEDPFSSKNFKVPFMLLPPVLDDINIRKYFKEKYIFDDDTPSAVAFNKCAESILQAGKIHKRNSSKIKVKFADRRVLDSHNTKLSRFMSKKVAANTDHDIHKDQVKNRGNHSQLVAKNEKVNVAQSPPKNRTKEQNSGKMAGLMRILSSALVDK